jgi:branched-chain amino acid transport system substrate-binding protein
MNAVWTWRSGCLFVAIAFLASLAWIQPALSAAPALRPVHPASIDRDELEIGAVISFTGRKAALAVHQIRGYDLAVQRINDLGGIVINNRHHRLKIRYKDDQSKRRVAIEAANELADDGVQYMLGGFSSGLVNAVAEVAEERGIPLVQGGGALLSLYEKDRRHLFGVVSTIDNYLTSILSLAVERARDIGKAVDDISLAISVVQGPAGMEARQPVIDLAARLGIDVVVDHRLSDPIGLAEIEGLLDDVALARPDIFLVFGYDSGARLTVDALARRRIDLPVFGTTHCDGAKIENLGAAADYALCVSQWDAYANYADRWFDTSVDFLVDFEMTYGYPPPYQAAQGAGTVLALADAFERAGALDRSRVREALARTNLDSMFGPIRFDGSGKNIAKPMVVLQLQNGRYKVVWPDDLAWSRAVIPAPGWSER